MVHPMSSMSGYVAYLKYTTGTAKGDIASDTELRSPFKQGDAIPDYTSARVVETFKGNGTNKDFTVMWTPVFDVKGEDGKYVALKVKVAGADIADDQITVDSKTGKITLGTAPANDAEVKIAYVYDNIVIPQNEIPSIKAVMDNIPLIAKARRIAVYFSQIAAFQAKTDYGFDLGDSLAEQAVGELSYEIDTEIINLLDETAGVAQDNLKWSKTLPVGVNAFAA